MAHQSIAIIVFYLSVKQAEVAFNYARYTAGCRDEKARLTKPCADEIFKTQMEAAADYRTDADLHIACEPDAKQICKDVKPGEGRIQDCLVWLS